METRCLGLFCLVVSAAILPGQSLVAGPTIGVGVRGAGDADGDGVGDLLVRTPMAWTVVSGATGATLAPLSHALAAPLVPLFDDVDGDGCSDFAYGTEVLSGADGSVLWNLPPDAEVALFARDVDNDGWGDVFYRTPEMLFGQHQVVLVSGRTQAVLAQRINFDPQQLPAVVFKPAFFGDLDGDGREEYGFHRQDPLISGGIPPYDELQVLSWTYPSVAQVGLMGGIGDFDGDGRSEVLTGSGGVTGLPVQPASAAWGTALGDLDGDGCVDFFNWFVWPQPISGATHAAIPGGFAPSPPWTFEVLGDVDGDGRAEVADNGTRFDWVDVAVPTASRLTRRGASGTTSLGWRPRLVPRGHCGLGHTTFLDVRGALPGGLTLLAFGAASSVDLAPFGAPGNHSYTSVDGLLLLATAADGVAQFQTTIATSSALLGARLSLQAVAVDLAANALGLVTSNAIDLAVDS